MKSDNFLQAKLMELRLKIDAYKYNTKKKREYERRYGALLSAINKVDEVCEDIQEYADDISDDNK